MPFLLLALCGHRPRYTKMETEKRGRPCDPTPPPSAKLFLPLFCEATSLSLKIGRNIAITIPPTITPRKTISNGSIKRSVHRASLRFLRPRSPPFSRAWCRSCRWLRRTRPFLTTSAERSPGFFDMATERLSPFSTSSLTPRILCSTTKIAGGNRQRYRALPESARRFE